MGKFLLLLLHILTLPLIYSFLLDIIESNKKVSNNWNIFLFIILFICIYMIKNNINIKIVKLQFDKSKHKTASS